ncbi:hypothetical protein K438DRAFT_2168101 [Mycena galopus ATCC 62051]|nr:hypothetical protein K438DRAFT_2168101 [Mycena galopus ATCC 62051]
MRSMRKITAVLGETPVVETTSPAAQLLAPSNSSSNSGHKRGFFFHASSLLSSLALPLQKSESSSHGHAPEPRPSLVLRVPGTFTFEPLPSPLSPSFSPTLMSPSSPPEAEPDHRRLSRKSLAHPRRICSPPELIFTVEPSIKRRRRASALVLPESALKHQLFALQGVLVDGEEPRSTRRPVLNRSVKAIRCAMSFIMPTDVIDADAGAETSVDDPTSPLGEAHVHPVAAFSPDAMSPLSHLEGSWLRSRPGSRATRPAPAHRRVFSPAPDVHREVAFAGFGAPPTYEESHQHTPVHHDSAPERSHTPMQRQEDDWTGEWRGDVGNMNDVVHKLCGLRVK